MAKVELELRGAGDEPVHFWRTVNSHGLNDLLPNRIDTEARTLELTLHPGPQTVVVREARPGVATIEGRAPRAVREVVRHVLRLDEDLSELYRLLAEDPHLAWTTVGAGRMMRSPTVFEDVVKTRCHSVRTSVGLDGAPSEPASSGATGPPARRRCHHGRDARFVVAWITRNPRATRANAASTARSSLSWMHSTLFSEGLRHQATRSLSISAASLCSR